MTATAHTRFAIVGAGGLGGPAACALAASGAREIAICDPDRVELSNLHRQVQFSAEDLGRPKVAALADELVRRGFPRERVRISEEALAAESAARLLGGADVVLEGSDDPPTKFVVNDWCAAAGVPYVIAGVLRYGGQVFAGVPPTLALHPEGGGDDRGGCYRCLFEAPPPDHEARSCAEAGVLGPAAGVLGGAAARAALALAAGARESYLEVYDDVTRALSPRRVRYNTRPDCPACAAAPRAQTKEAL